MKAEYMKRTDRLLLYAVTDGNRPGAPSLYSRVEAALKWGANLVQLREKELDEANFLEEAGKMRELCHKYKVPLIINDHVEIALAADADGVHLGQKDMSVREARGRLGEGKIIGVSARTVSQALEAQRQGADYLGTGAVFPTGSKADAKPLSHETLRAICGAVSIPVVAIGGISKENVMQLAGNGVSGIAVISALFAQPDIEAAAVELKALAAQMVRRWVSDEGG